MKKGVAIVLAFTLLIGTFGGTQTAFATEPESTCTEHSPVIDEAVEPTCTESGLTEGSHCSVCNEIIVEQETVPALGHSFTDYVLDDNATCENGGTETAKCDRCDITDTRTVTGHDYEVTSTAFTAGYVITTSTCKRCGDVITSKNPDTGVMKNESGTWCYYVSGKFQSGYNGFASNQYGTWYIKNGTVAWGTGGNTPTTGTIIKGTIDGTTAWYLVCNAKVTDATTVAKNQNGWWYVENGVVDFSCTSIKKNDNGWWRIVNGKVDFSCNSVEKNENGWWKLKGGKVDFSYNGVAVNKNGWWFIKYGAVDFSYTSMAKNDTAMCQAVQFVLKNSKTTDSNTKRLSDCCTALRKNSYYKMSTTAPDPSEIPGCASFMFTNNKGNCYRFASSMCYVALALGFNAHVSTGGVTSYSDRPNLSSHGWCDIYINGTWTIWDLSMQRNSTKKLVNTTYSAYPYSLRRVYIYTYGATNGKLAWTRTASSWANTSITRIY